MFFPKIVNYCKCTDVRLYGCRKVLDDLRELGENVRQASCLPFDASGEAALADGYHRRPGVRAGPVAVLAPNHLQQQFEVAEPIRVCVTGITYIRTHEGWLFLAAVLDLFSR
jgi:putative transposase